MTGLALGAPVDPEFAHELIAAAIEADRERRLPPVSPEAREELARTKVPIIDASGKTHWVDLGYECADAILARFSVPSQPVYDEEAIARWLFGLRYHSMHWLDAKEPERDEYRRDAAALVAALRGGELTREETTL